MKSKLKKTILPLLVGIVIFLATLHLIGIDEIFQNLLKLNVYLYLLAIGFIGCTLGCWSLRWKVFIKADGHDVPFFDLFKNLLVGLALNNLTPLAKMGGEPLRAYLLKKKNGIKMREGFATVLAELTIFLIVTTCLVVLSIFLITVGMNPPTWLIFVLIPFGIVTTLGFFGIVGVYSGRKIIVKIIKWFGNKIERLKPHQERLLERYKEFQLTFRKCLEKKSAFVKALGYTLLGRTFGFVKFFVLFAALDYQIDPIKIIIAMGISVVILSLPSTPGSLGIYEGGFTSALVLLGIPAGVAGTVVFLDRLVWFWGITLVGGSLGAYYGVNILESKEGKRVKT